MVDTDRTADLLDGVVIGSDGEMIGDVGEVYTDDATGAPTWVTVKTGWFGLSESFVPLAGAEIAGNQITVPYNKATIKDSPTKEPDAPLSERDEEELHRYYDRAGSADVIDPESSGVARSGGRDLDGVPDRVRSDQRVQGRGRDDDGVRGMDQAGASRSEAERGDGDENWSPSQMAAAELPDRPADADVNDPAGWTPEQLETQGASADTYAGGTPASVAPGGRSDDPNWRPQQMETEGADPSTYREQEPQRGRLRRYVRNRD